MKKPERQNLGLPENRSEDVKRTVSSIEDRRQEVHTKVLPKIVFPTFIIVFVFFNFILPKVKEIKDADNLFDKLVPVILWIIVPIATAFVFAALISKIFDKYFDNQAEEKREKELKVSEYVRWRNELELKRINELEKKQIELTKKQFWMNQDGYTFERNVAEIFERLGHHVRLTKGSGDEGVDIFVDEHTIVQCKATESQAAPSIVRDLYGAMHHFNSTKGIIVSTGGFSSGCYQFARDKSIELWDLAKLLEVAGKLGIGHKGN